MLGFLKGEHMETVLGVGSWTVCSVGMMVFNKLAIKAFPLECTLVSMQMAFCALAMVVFYGRSIHIGSFRDVLRWSMVVPFFTGMLLTSILALKSSSMTLVVTLRVLSPVVSLIIERFYPNPVGISRGILLSIGLMVFGTALYLSQLPMADIRGAQWVLLNMLFAVGDRLLQRLMLAKDQCPVDISKTGVTLLNNLEGLVPMLIAALWKGELHEAPTVMANLGAHGWAIVAASCVVGVGISYCGIWAQSLISATSFLVLVNANKFFIIFIEVFIMRTLHLHPIQAAGTILALFAGIGYGNAREAIESDEKAAKLAEECSNDPEVAPLLPKQP